MTARKSVPFGRLRTVASAGLIVTARRARRDLLFLIAWGLLVAFVALIAVAAPRQVTDTVDRGARQAVASAGSLADLVVTVPVGTSFEAPGSLIAPQRVLTFSTSIARALPVAISRVSAGNVTTVLGPVTNAATINGRDTSANLRVQIAMLTASNRAGLRLTSGHLPGPLFTDGSVPVILSEADARAVGAKVGTVIGVAANAGFGEELVGSPISLQVVGIVAQSVGHGADWLDTPGLWSPSHPPSPQVPSPIGITVLTALPGVTSAQSSYADGFNAVIRVRLDPSRFTAELEPKVHAEIGALELNATSLTGGSGAPITVTSDFDDALSAFPTESRAAVAQMSLVLAGLLGVALTVLILTSQLLVRRRRYELSLERARGAALGATAYRAAVESGIIALAASMVGFGAAQLSVPGPLDDPIILVGVVVIAIVTGPLQSVLLVRREGSPVRAPTNPQDKLEIQKRVRGRRIALEVTVLALATAALVLIATRGLLETRTSGIDPLLAAAPLLCAAVTTLMILRMHRAPVRAVAAVVRRGRGVVGLLGASRSENAISVLPLLALTLAVTLVVGGSVLVATVDDGQVTASWQRIGGDARVDASISDARIAQLAGQPGVLGVAAMHVAQGVLVQSGATTASPTLLAIDGTFAKFVSKLPADTLGTSDVSSLGSLERSSSGPGGLPVIVTPQLAAVLPSKDFSIYYGVSRLRLHEIGVTDVEPSGYLQGPFIYVGRTALTKRIASLVASGTLARSQLSTLTEANEVLIVGPGASRAATSAGVAASAIHPRSAWLAVHRQRALIAGTQQTVLLATIAIALLASIALIATALAGARDRGRALALLRTLGLPASFGAWLALAELLPLVIAALLGGIAAGIGILSALEPTLGLRVLTGGLSNPVVVVPIPLMVGLAIATVALVGLAVLVEFAVRRRDRLGEILRVGETV